MNKPYENKRPRISSEVKRLIEVESGHSCCIKGCGEHSYLEIHHIDENRENNKPENLILLCDKHHKMSHKGVIDRKALKEYKRLLNQNQNSIILDRFNELEKLIISSNDDINSKPLDNQPYDDTVKAKGADRLDIFHFCLKHYSIGHFEKNNNTYFKHQVEFSRGNDKLRIDGLRQDDDLDFDIIIHFEFITKIYQDAPSYSIELQKKIELYELLTGRFAKGILLITTDNRKIYDEQEHYLEMTIGSVEKSHKKIELVVYSCDDIGFDRSSIHNIAKESNLK